MFIALDDPGKPIGVMHRLPSPPAHLFEGGSSVIVPAVVVPEQVAIGVAHPCHLRNRVSENAELFFAGFDFAACEDLLGDFDAKDQDAVDGAVAVAGVLIDKVEVSPAVLT